MNSTKFLFLVFCSIISIKFCVNQLNGRCGYPGKPYRAKLEPDNKLQYDEGEEVSYQCTDFWSNVQTRKCVKGIWTQTQPRCGDFVKDILLKDSKMEDISDPDNPIKIFQHKNMTIVNTNWKYPNVFTSNRFPTARLRVFDSKKYKWTFNFTGPAVKLFVRINFNIMNYTLISQEARDNFTFNVSINVGPHRKCELIHYGEEIWRHMGIKTENDFICDSISAEDHIKDVMNPSNTMTMETQSSIDIPHDFIVLTFGKSYGTELEPLCGEPEFTISQLSRFNAQFKDYTVACKTAKYLYTSTKNDIIPESIHHGLKCIADMKWVGSYPDCLPKRPCPIEHLLIGKHSNRTVVTSLDGLYFFNDTTFYAIEGTEVNYGCNNPSSDILVGSENRECRKNGVWSGTEAYCYNPNESSKFTIWMLIAILFCALLLILGLTAILFYVYTKRIKKSNQNRIDSEKFETYDDIDINNDKLYDTTYETVGDGDVRYADPYYTADTDYVQMPNDMKNQSSDSYWRLPATDPTYLEMINSNKNSPCQSLNKFPIDQKMYTCEL